MNISITASPANLMIVNLKNERLTYEYSVIELKCCRKLKTLSHSFFNSQKKWRIFWFCLRLIFISTFEVTYLWFLLNILLIIFQASFKKDFLEFVPTLTTYSIREMNHHSNYFSLPSIHSQECLNFKLWPLALIVIAQTLTSE